MRQHISVAQLAGFFLANLCGMVIVLLGIQFYKDVLPVFTQGDSFMKKDYVIVSKQVSTLGSLVGKGGTFSRADIADMESQPFAKRTGAFTPAQFQVSAGMGMAGMQLSTAMFFESVPDEFVDVRLEGWTYREGQTEIPIIIPRNYLNLYNFGFAQSRNLPQLSEGVMGMMTLDVRLSGRGRTERMKGRIVGFSNRLNTILVPQAFMEWANATLGDGGQTAPSRLIVEVDNPADDRIAKYFKQKGYETEGADYQCAVVLPADAEHLPAVAEEHEEAGEPADDWVQSSGGGASVSGTHGGAECSGGSHGRTAGVDGT